jgi:hypothetical protein
MFCEGLSVPCQSLAGLIMTSASRAVSPEQQPITADEWISETLVTKASDSPLKLQRFREPIWVLLAPISWKPSNASQAKFKPVTVPKNFVTDLASIPRVFWSLMPRDDVYAYPAIVHDYLYWDQSREKQEADLIFKWSMKDLEVPKVQVDLIYKGVELLGRSAWNENTALKKSGQRRILKSPPPSSNIRWSDWKTHAELFI